MIKKTMLLFFGLCAVVVGVTQQINSAVISPAGEVSKTNNLYLEWTLGESFVESIFSSKHLYTQGFHQPVKITKVPLPYVPPDQEWSKVTILPNPVQTTGKVIIERTSISKLQIELTDVTGKPLLHRTSYSKYQVIDLNLSTFSAGVYTLVIRNASGSLLKTFKIIKAL